MLSQVKVQQGSGEGSGAMLQSQVRVWEALVQSQARFNRVPEKVLEKVWEALVQSQVNFNRVSEKVPEKVWEALVQSQVKFNRVPEKVPEKVPGGFGAEPGQVQQCSAEEFGRLWCRARSGSTVPGRFRRRSGRLWCRARSTSTEFRRRFRRRFGRLWCSQVRFNRVPEKVPEKVWEALVQSQVRFNRVPEKVPEKVPGSLSAKPSQVQRVPEKVPEKAWEALVQSYVGEGSGEGLGGFGAVRFNRALEKVWEALVQSQQGSGEGSGEGSRKPWCKAKSGSQRVPEKVAEKVPEKVFGIFGARPGEVQQVQQGFQRLASQHASERFVKIKHYGCWGYHRSVFFILALKIFFSRVEPDLALHQSLPDLLRNLLRNPVEPDLAQHPSLPEPSPEPSSEPC